MPASVFCDFIGCPETFTSKPGRGLCHCRDRKAWYNQRVIEATRSRYRAQWTRKESALPARWEAELTIEERSRHYSQKPARDIPTPHHSSHHVSLSVLRVQGPSEKDDRGTSTNNSSSSIAADQHMAQPVDPFSERPKGAGLDGIPGGESRRFYFPVCLALPP